MQACLTQVQYLKVDDTIIEDQSGFAIKIIGIHDADKGEPVGVYYTENYKTPKLGSVPGIKKLEFKAQHTFFLNHYDTAVVLASFPERNK